MAIPLVALQTFTYNGRLVRPNDSFLAQSKQDAQILTVVRKARYQTKTVKAEPLPPIEDDRLTVSCDPENDPEKPKRRYRRRDLTADPE